MKIEQLDVIDQSILALLAANSRMSFVDIAKAVGLSRVAVASRIEALENSGVIEQYTILVNPHKMGSQISAFFDIETTPQELFAVSDALESEEVITDLYHMTGASNLHAHGLFPNQKALDDFLREGLYQMKGVVHVNSRLILTRIKSRKSVRL